MASSFSTVGAAGHRASCHRCGNLRKRNVFCSRCPHTFCERCASKLVAEHGDIFSKGCPLCLGLCCCGDPRGTHVCSESQTMGHVLRAAGLDTITRAYSLLPSPYPLPNASRSPAPLLQEVWGDP